MKTSSICSALGLLLLACVVGCGTESTALVVVPDAETAALPQSCTGFLDADDDSIMWARAAGAASALILDTPDGSCRDERARVLATLQAQHRFELAAHIAQDFAAADPSPHPDLSDGVAEADPSPHPDKPQGAVSADPSPHPDRDTTDDEEDTFAIVIVVVVGGSTGGSGTPPPPTPPTPGQMD